MPKGDVVPLVHQVLHKRWLECAGMTVIELEEGADEFMVSEQYNDDNDVKNENNNTTTAGSVSTLWSININAKQQNIVKPRQQYCTCGKWQEHRYPCRHGMAYFWKWEEQEFKWVLDNKVHYFYKYECLQALYKPNLLPVITESIRYDGITLPPIPERTTGRPKTKRIRRQSLFVDPSDSTITCSKCGQKGHNQRTCSNEAVAVNTN